MNPDTPPVNQQQNVKVEAVEVDERKLRWKPWILSASCIFAFVGAGVLLLTQAAVVFSGFELESGAASAGATLVNDSTASGGRAVKFGTTVVTTPPGAGSLPTQTTNCAPKPSACGYPDATNTGVPAGTSLRHVSGNYTVTTANMIVSNLDIDGTLNIEADGVIVKNTRVRGIGEDSWIVSLYTHTTLQDVEIGGGASGSDWSAATAIYTGGNTSGNKIVRVNIHQTQDGVRLDGGTTLQDSYIHTLNFNYPYHSDGIQATQGDNDVIRHNTIEGGNNDCIFLQTTGSDPQIHNVTIDNNLLLGVQAAPGDLSSFGVSNETARNVTLTGNSFNRTWQVGATNGMFVTFSGNHYDDGAALSP